MATKTTPWKINIEPTNHPIERKIIFQTSIFGFHDNFPGWNPQLWSNPFQSLIEPPRPIEATKRPPSLSCPRWPKTMGDSNDLSWWSQAMAGRRSFPFGAWVCKRPIFRSEMLVSGRVCIQLFPCFSLDPIEPAVKQAICSVSMWNFRCASEVVDDEKKSLAVDEKCKACKHVHYWLN